MHWMNYIVPLLEGAWVTVQLTVISTLGGAFFSFLFGIGRLSSSRTTRWLCISLIEIFRGTSLLVQLFWLYFALPLIGEAIGVNLRLPPVAAGALALSLNIGAYGADRSEE